MNIAVLVSGSGTNLQALIDAELSGELCGGKIKCVISSKEGVFALDRAKNAGIETEVLPSKQSREDIEEKLLSILEFYDIDLIILAGFLSILGQKVINRFRNKIINIHPSLIPSFCGKGYYGLKVHKAALDYGVKITGATVHFVNEIPDAGAIILQKAVEIKDNDTPEKLQKRVMQEAEWELLTRSVSLFCAGRIKIVGNRTKII